MLFERYGDRVKYWLTFNEINSVLHAPFMCGGINTPKDQLPTSDLYQAIHHELVACALATRIAHEIDPGRQGRLHGPRDADLPADTATRPTCWR